MNMQKDGKAAFRRWRARHDRLLRFTEPTGPDTAVRTAHSPTHTRVQKQRHELIRVIKERFPNKHPLDMAALFHRYHRMYRTFEAPNNKNQRQRKKMNGQIENVPKWIEEQRKELGLTKTAIAEAAGIKLPSLYHYTRDGAEMSDKMLQNIKKLFEEHSTPKEEEPITVKEVAHYKKRKLERNEPEEFKKRTPDVVKQAKKEVEQEQADTSPPPTLKKLQGGGFVSLQDLDRFRDVLHVPQIFIDKALGKNPGWWSYRIRNNKAINPKTLEQARRILINLALLGEGVNLEPVGEKADTDEIIEALKTVRQHLTLIPSHLQMKIALNTISAIEDEIRRLS